MSNDETIKKQIKQLYQEKLFGVFSSVWKNRSHQTLVCFVATEDLKFIVFGTPRESRKFINTQLFEKVSFFVDSTHNDPKDKNQAIAVSAVGKAYSGDKLSENKKEELMKLYLAKHPYQEEFITSPSTQFVLLEVDHYQFVHNFQTVVEWSPNKEQDTILFRQIMGEKIAPGFLRGKVRIISQESEIGEINQNEIIWVRNLELLKQIVMQKPGAVITEAEIKDEIGITYAKEHNIPMIGNLENLQKYVHPNDELSVDGYLGFVILNEIR